MGQVSRVAIDRWRTAGRRGLLARHLGAEPGPVAEADEERGQVRGCQGLTVAELRGADAVLAPQVGQRERQVGRRLPQDADGADGSPGPKGAASASAPYRRSRPRTPTSHSR